MENSITESGEEITVEECRRCGAQNVRGVEFIRAGVKVFKCGECGKGMNNGYLEESHKKQIEGRDGHTRATEQRDRFWRENMEKQEIEYKKLAEIPGEHPEEVFNIQYATKKWKF